MAFEIQNGFSEVSGKISSACPDRLNTSKDIGQQPLERVLSKPTLAPHSFFSSTVNNVSALMSNHKNG
jgi:hypothetical protein